MFKFLDKAGIRAMFDDTLGERHPRAEYSNSDMLLGWIATVHTQGYRLSRLEETKEDLFFLGLNVCSPDTMGRFLKNMAFENRHVNYWNPKKKKTIINHYTVSENSLLVNLLVNSTKNMGGFSERGPKILDFDSTPLYSENLESKRIYKGGVGYSAMVGMINKSVVYVDQRSGNAPPEFETQESLEKCLKVLSQHEIPIDLIRSDGGGYTKKVTNFIQSKGIKFLIGADWANRTYSLCQEHVKYWRKAKIKTYNTTWNAEVASFPFSFAGEANEYRMIAVRAKNIEDKKNKKIAKWTKVGDYHYKFILTNDLESSEYDLTLSYHKRGGFERNFDYLKNDFGWKILPFSHMNENLPYLIVCALANNTYRAFLRIVALTFEKIKITFRLGTFLRKFIKGTVDITNGKYDFSRAKIDYEKIM